MDRRKKDDTGRFIPLITVAGSILGAVAGLIFAPHSGKKTREKLSGSYDTLVENFHNLLKDPDKGISQLTHIVSQVKVEIKDVPENVKEELVNFSKDTERRVSHVVESGKRRLKKSQH